LVAKRLGYSNNRSYRGEVYLSADKYEIFPVDVRHSIDLKHMIMYETKNPDTYYRVYRSGHNNRQKPNDSLLNCSMATSAAIFSPRSRP